MCLLHNLVRLDPAPRWQLNHIPYNGSHQDVAAFADFYIVIDKRADVENGCKAELYIPTDYTMSTNDTTRSDFSIRTDISGWMGQGWNVIPVMQQYFRLKETVSIIPESYDRITVILPVGWKEHKRTDYGLAPGFRIIINESESTMVP